MSKPVFILPPRSQTAGYMIFSSLLVLILTAVVLSLILHHFQIRENNDVPASRRIHDLMEQLKIAQDKRNALSSELDDIRKKMLSDAKDPTTATNTEDPEVQKLYRIAGLTPAAGSGLVVTLQNNTAKPIVDDPHADPNSGKLQAEDLLRLVNELKAGGATAISINDQRLVTTSEIVASGPMIAVNATRLSQPIVVRVLGNPDLLERTLKFPGGVLEYLDFFNVKVSLKKKSNINLPAYKGPIS